MRRHQYAIVVNYQNKNRKRETIAIQITSVKLKGEKNG